MSERLNTPTNELGTNGEIRADFHLAGEHIRSFEEGQQIAAARLAVEAARDREPRTPTPVELVARQGLILLSSRRAKATGTFPVVDTINEDRKAA